MPLGKTNISTVWALVANSSHARIFEIKARGKEINKVHECEHPQSRLRSREIDSDREGHGSKAGGGTRRFAMPTPHDSHEYEQTLFAKELSEILKKGRDQQKFEELTLVAPAQFLGKLHQAMHGPLKKCIVNEFQRDLPGSLSDKEIIDHLCQYLDLIVD